MKNRVLMTALGAAMMVPLAAGAVPPPVTHVAPAPVPHIVAPPVAHPAPRVRLPTHPMHLATAIPSKAPCLHSGCPPVPQATVIQKKS